MYYACIQNIILALACVFKREGNNLPVKNPMNGIRRAKPLIPTGAGVGDDSCYVTVG